MQDLHTAGFTIETPVHGDVTIGIWLGGHKRDRDVPALAYQFHTAMLDSNQVRLLTGQDLSGLVCGADAEQQSSRLTGVVHSCYIDKDWVGVFPGIIHKRKVF